MFWQFLTSLAIGIALINLGALSMLVTIFKAMVLLLFFLLIVIGLVFAWRRYWG